MPGEQTDAISGAADDAALAIDPVVTPADIEAAYRLLLGRRPDRSGLRTFGQFVGRHPVSDLVRCLLSSEEFRRSSVGGVLTRDEHDELRVVQVDGFRIVVSPHDILNRGITEGGVYEPHVTAAMRSVLRPGMTFVDVGANIGYYTNLAADLVGPAGRVLAFEARAATARLCNLSVLANGFRNVQVLTLALCDRATTFAYVPAQGTNGWVEEVGSMAEGASSEPDLSAEFVSGVALDDLGGLVGDVHVMKIDVEGNEPRVIAGATQVMSRCRPVLFTEFAPEMLTVRCGRTALEYLGSLVELGYGRFLVLTDDGPIDFEADVAGVVTFAEQSARGSTHVDLCCRAT